MPRLVHICTSEQKGTVKTSVSEALLIADRGIEGDAHAGPGRRQVSILALADIDYMRQKGLTLPPGSFGENLVVEGLSPWELPLGTVLTVGQAKLRISQVGKVCHHRCAIYFQTGECIMPQKGVFATVEAGGRIHCPMEITVSALDESNDSQARGSACA